MSKQPRPEKFSAPDRKKAEFSTFPLVMEMGKALIRTHIKSAVRRVRRDTGGRWTPKGEPASLLALIIGTGAGAALVIGMILGSASGPASSVFSAVGPNHVVHATNTASHKPRSQKATGGSHVRQARGGSSAPIGAAPVAAISPSNQPNPRKSKDLLAGSNQASPSVTTLKGQGVGDQSEIKIASNASKSGSSSKDSSATSTKSSSKASSTTSGSSSSSQGSNDHSGSSPPSKSASSGSSGSSSTGSSGSSGSSGTQPSPSEAGSMTGTQLHLGPISVDLGMTSKGSDPSAGACVNLGILDLGTCSQAGVSLGS